jgi:hypothetical protein
MGPRRNHTRGRPIPGNQHLILHHKPQSFLVNGWDAVIDEQRIAVGQEKVGAISNAVISKRNEDIFLAEPIG